MIHVTEEKVMDWSVPVSRVLIPGDSAWRLLATVKDSGQAAMAAMPREYTYEDHQLP